MTATPPPDGRRVLADPAHEAFACEVALTRLHADLVEQLLDEHPCGGLAPAYELLAQAREQLEVTNALDYRSVMAADTLLLMVKASWRRAYLAQKPLEAA